MTTRRTFMKQAGLAAALTLGAGFAPKARTGLEAKRVETLRQTLAAYATTLKIPGLVAAIVEDGTITFLQALGSPDLDQKIPIRRDHIFPLASLSKTFAAVTLALYQQQGRITLDDYVLDYPFLSVGFSPERLQHPNAKLKHVLSHTSEGIPGSNYIYNGNRYNFVYGVFEKISGNTSQYEAVGQEVARRILTPLGMTNTLAGYPSDPNDPRIGRIVTTYQWDRNQQVFKVDPNLKRSTIFYPSNGLLSTIDDLAAYTTALDRNTLLSADSYHQLTTPFVTNQGRVNPYGLGWSIQQVGDKTVHWHYGYGDSYAALLVRIPQQKQSFILLSNSVAASEPFLLGYGNLLNSPFAQAFFRHIDNIPESDEHFSQAQLYHWTATQYKAHLNEVVAQLQKTNRQDIAAIWLMSELGDSRFRRQMESALQVYEAGGWFHPDIHRRAAQWYEKMKDSAKAITWYHRLADADPGYGEQSSVQAACQVLAEYYFRQGKVATSRDYQWRVALYRRHNGAGLADTAERIEQLKK